MSTIATNNNFNGNVIGLISLNTFMLKLTVMIGSDVIIDKCGFITLSSVSNDVYSWCLSLYFGSQLDKFSSGTNIILESLGIVNNVQIACAILDPTWEKSVNEMTRPHSRCKYWSWALPSTKNLMHLYFHIRQMESSIPLFASKLTKFSSSTSLIIHKNKTDHETWCLLILLYMYIAILYSLSYRQK